MKIRTGDANQRVLFIVSLQREMVDALSTSKKQDMTINESLNNCITKYLSHTVLAPQEQGVMLSRVLVNKGEVKLKRFMLPRSTVDLLNEAEQMGYSRSLIVERAIKEGLMLGEQRAEATP